MEKKLKDYLHLYFGCEVSYLGEVWFMGAIHIFPENPNSIGGINIWNKGIVEQVQCSEIKPILRPLSDMTKEERKELWKLVFNREFGVNGNIQLRDHLPTPSGRTRWVLMSGVERLGIQFDGKVWYDSDLQHWNFSQHEVTRWLLSKHFDLFGLIESGLAIDKTTLNPHTNG